MLSVGKKIKELRELKGFTQEQVADYLNISQPTYARIENGQRNSWANYLESICVFFEVQPEELFKDSSVIINNNQKGGAGYIQINQLSEKLNEQHEINAKLYKENAELKDRIILDLQNRLKNYED